MQQTIHRPLVAGNQRRAFGGALMADLLSAADELCRPEGDVHALHGQFLRPGQGGEAAEFTATTLRETANFATVDARVHQNHRLVAAAMVSFHRARPSREHAARATPPSLSPEEAPQAIGGPIPAVTAALREDYDLRDPGAGKPLATGIDGRPIFQFWVRSRIPTQGRTARASALIWISDFFLTHVADAEHAGSPGQRRAASLDHTMWFHQPANPGDWLLYELQSPAYRDSLALTTGRFFDRDGGLVASVAQQSLLRRTTAESTIRAGAGA